MISEQLLKAVYAEGFRTARKDSTGSDTDDELVNDFWEHSASRRDFIASQDDAVPPSKYWYWPQGF